MPNADTVQRAGPGFNVENFVAFIKDAGILKDYQFVLNVPMPAALQNRTGIMTDTNKSIQFMCDTVNFPGTGVFTYTMKRYGYGADEPRPIFPKFSPLITTFTCDREANIQKFFHEWIKVIANYDFYNGVNGASTIGGGGLPMGPYDISYKPEYAVDIELVIFTPTGEEIRHVMFREAFPVNVIDVQFSWSSINKFVKIPVQFMFTDWFDLDLHGTTSTLPSTAGQPQTTTFLP